MKKQYNINSIKSISPTYTSDGYVGACAIDPDIKINGRIGGAITPNNYQLDTSAVRDVMWFETNDVNDNTYYYTKDGAFGYIDVSGNVSAVSALTGSSGNGMAYYNNYYYLAKDTDVARYGPLNSTPTLTDNWWSAQDTLEKLTNTTYAEVGDYKIPNHPMYVHPDKQLYIADYQGQGTVHRLKMIDKMDISGSSGTFTVGEEVSGATSKARATIFSVTGTELGVALAIGTFTNGETVTGTTGGEATVTGYTIGNKPILKEMNALTWAFEEYPVAMDSFGTDLLILTMKNSKNINKGNSVLFVWDTFDTQGFHAAVKLPYPITTAIKTYNGIPYIWGGDNEGYSLSRYLGGETIEPFIYIDNGELPLQGAVAAQHNRLVWGSTQTYPEARGCVWSWSSRARFGGLHNIISAGDQVSALRPQELTGTFLIGTDKGLYTSGGDYDSIWRSEMISFGRMFDIHNIYIPLGATLKIGDKITVVLHYDNETIKDEFEIDKDTYETNTIKIQPEQKGIQNFFIEIKIEGPTKVPIILPIAIEYDILE
jgi:hypothetical protein